MSETTSRSTAGQLLSIVASGWARLVLTFIAGTIITLLMIREFGLIRFGMFVMIVQLTDLTVYTFLSALSKSMVRELTTSRVRRDQDRIQQVFSSGVMISLVLFFLISLLGLPLQELGARILDFPEDYHTDLRVCIMTTTVVSAVLIGISPWQATMTSAGRIMQLHGFHLLCRLSDLAALLLAVAASDQHAFIIFLWLRLALRSLCLFGLVLYARRLEIFARFNARFVSKKTLREIVGTGGWAMGIPISQLSFYELDQIFLNIFIGPIYNSIYGISNQVRGYARLAGSSIMIGTDALATDLQERGRLDSVRNVLDATIRFPLVITGCCAIVLGTFSGPVVTLWLGDAIAEGMPENGMSASELIDIITTFIAVFLVGTVVAEPHYTAASVLYGMGHLKRFSPLLLIASVVKIGLAAGMLAYGFPAISTIAVTVGLQILVYGVYFPWLIADVSQRSVFELVRTVYLRPLISLGVFLGVALTVRSLVEIDSLFMLGVVLAGVGSTYIPLAYFVALRPNERERLTGMIRGRLGRGRRAAATPLAGQSDATAEIDSSTSTPR